MNTEINSGNIRLEFDIKIIAAGQTVAAIQGKPEIPAMLIPDALSSSLGTFEAVFGALINRPCMIAVCRLIEEQMKQPKTAHTVTAIRQGMDDRQSSGVEHTEQKLWQEREAA